MPLKISKMAFQKMHPSPKNVLKIPKKCPFKKYIFFLYKLKLLSKKKYNIKN